MFRGVSSLKARGGASAAPGLPGAAPGPRGPRKTDPRRKARPRVVVLVAAVALVVLVVVLVGPRAGSIAAASALVCGSKSQQVDRGTCKLYSPPGSERDQTIGH